MERASSDAHASALSELRQNVAREVKAALGGTPAADVAAEALLDYVDARAPATLSAARPILDLPRLLREFEALPQGGPPERRSD